LVSAGDRAAGRQREAGWRCVVSVAVDRDRLRVHRGTARRYQSEGDVAGWVKANLQYGGVEQGHRVRAEQDGGRVGRGAKGRNGEASHGGGVIGRGQGRLNLGGADQSPPALLFNAAAGG